MYIICGDCRCEYNEDNSDVCPNCGSTLTTFDWDDPLADDIGTIHTAEIDSDQ